MRPPVSVVMPFGGDVASAGEALLTLRALSLGDHDERLLADNAGTLDASMGEAYGVRVVPAGGERSPAHARNAGARAARGEWVLFLDSDCTPPADLVDRYLSSPPGPRVGALAGAILPGPATSVAERYGAARNFLDQRAHLAHPFLPRAAAANLMVRRAAFEQVGGFLEGVRAGEDTDLSWRLQQAGWTLELREEAAVEHRYRSTLRDLRRQWRGYAAGRAWLARRYGGFTPEPAVARALRRLAVLPRSRRGRARAPAPAVTPGRPGAVPTPRERLLFTAIDGLLAVEELAGFALSNRPAPPVATSVRRTVFVAERFPDPDDPLLDLVRAVPQARVEAATRAPGTSPPAGVEVLYREDDGPLTRVASLARLVVRRPGPCLRVLLRRGGPCRGGPPSLLALAPAALRLARQPSTRVQPMGGGRAADAAQRLTGLAGSAVRSR